MIQFLTSILLSLGNVGAFAILAGAARTGLPVPIAFAIGVAAGGALGYAVERVFIRALRAQGPTAQTVGTVAAFGILVAVSAKVFGTSAQIGPSIFPKGFVQI